MFLHREVVYIERYLFLYEEVVFIERCHARWSLYRGALYTQQIGGLYREEGSVFYMRYIRTVCRWCVVTERVHYSSCVCLSLQSCSVRTTYVRICSDVRTYVPVNFVCTCYIITLRYQRVRQHSLCRDGTGCFVFPIHWYRSEIRKYAENRRKKATYS